jgi:peptidoglycan/LPS O-acetylase OafA/YrhL
VTSDAVEAPVASEMAARAVPRLSALTGLRIVAALAVYASHVGPPSGAPGALRNFMNSGYMGVTLFFTLSGFVLTINYFEGLQHPRIHSVWRFAVARFARVYPLYILILFYILVREHLIGVSITGWWQHVLAIQAWDSNVLRADDFNGPAWSVSVEVFLYACFPVLVLVFAKLNRIRTVLLTAAAVVLGMAGLVVWFILTSRSKLPWVDPRSAYRWLYETPLTRLGDFMLGILAARLYSQTRGRQRLGVERVSGPMTIFAALVIVLLMCWRENFYSVWSWDLAYALPGVVLIFGLATAPKGVLARALSLPLVVLLGEASYAFYLVHAQALVYFGAERYRVDISVTSVLYGVLTLGAILCLAVGLHVMVERPARLYIRRLAGSYSGRASNPAAIAEPDRAVTSQERPAII